MPTTFYELTAPSKTHPRGFAIDWVPADAGPDATGTCPPCGTLTIKDRRAYLVYTVTEFPTVPAGRGFYLAKTNGGGDPGESSYSCFVGRNGQDMQCGCKGFAYTGSCKHLLSLGALLENGWL